MRRFALAVLLVSACSKPLADYCANRECPSYDGALDGARSAAKSPSGTRVTYGTCGKFRYVEVRPPVNGSVTYYDASGKLVGAESFDYKAGDLGFGNVPSCALVPKEVLADGGLH